MSCQTKSHMENIFDHDGTLGGALELTQTFTRLKGTTPIHISEPIVMNLFPHKTNRASLFASEQLN